MKKALTILIAMLFVASMSVPVYADMGEKLKGGFEKIIKSPLQVKDHVVEQYEATDENFGKPMAIGGGILKGAFYMGKDMVTGLFDILTFPIDFEK